MENNQKIGLKTCSEKNIQELKRRINTARVDHDFYSTDFEFTSVEPQSANHLYGNGKWKKAMIDRFGKDLFDQHSEKYGNKAIDFKIVKLITPHSKYFSQNELIDIKDANGVYSGSIKVLSTDDCAVIVLMPFTCDSRGTIQNLSRKNGAQTALTKMNQLLSDMEPSAGHNTEPIVSNEPAKEQSKPVQEVVIENEAPVMQPTKTNYKKAIITTLSILAVIAIVVIIVKQISKKTN